MTTTEKLTEIATRWIVEGWQKGNASIIDELHAPHFVNRASAGRDTSREGFKQGIIDLYAAFPDLHAEIEDLVIDTAASKVAVRWSATGTHTGNYLNCPPTGKQIVFHAAADGRTGVKRMYNESEGGVCFA
jgi:predicted ester cyclase